MVPKVFVNEIKADNYKFNEEVVKYQVDKIVKSIYEKYKQRLDKVS